MSEAALERFPCPGCGAQLEFAAGTAEQRCPFCGHTAAIPKSKTWVRELDFEEYFRKVSEGHDTIETAPVHCKACGAEVRVGDGLAADVCGYCGAAFVAAGGSRRIIKPGGLLPFKVTAEQASAAIRAWLKGRWFLPTAMKRRILSDTPLAGMYVPYWTYDCKTVTNYNGERGDDYYTTEYYTTIVNGRIEQRTRQVRRTRWAPVSGVVRNAFDDILVLASRSLPEKVAAKLEPWDLEQIAPYDDRYVSGFRAENYRVGLGAGFLQAQARMDPVILETVRKDIGGDHQRVGAVRVRHDDVTFKHLLLPVWISAFRHGGKVYPALVNARTGEAQGERPWSWIKIALTVGGVVAAAMTAFWLVRQHSAGM